MDSKQKKKEKFQINFQINKQNTKQNKPTVMKNRCDYRKKKKSVSDKNP